MRSLGKRSCRVAFFLSLFIILSACLCPLTMAADCHFELPGDWNNDCRVNLDDLAVVAAHWLINCIALYDPACIPLDLDGDGYDVLNDCDDHDPNIYPGAPELCDGLDNDCDTIIDESCTTEVCNGIDDDGDGLIDQDDPDMVSPLCTNQEGVCSGSIQLCIGGLLQPCDNSTYTAHSAHYEPIEMSCDGLDNDCDGSIDEGNPGGGGVCDGSDSDLCMEGTYLCQVGTLVCSDNTASTLDLCNGMDDDCDPASSDGSEDPMNGSTCDGTDSDLCKEGTISCLAGALACSDATGSTLDLCNGMDDDCDPASSDGSEDPMIGSTCDGMDSDLCKEGTISCLGGALACSDNTASTLDLCNGMNDDCDPASSDGSEDPMNGSTCDGTDSDLCKEGTISCLAGALACSDATGSTLDLCNGMDDDCDPSSSDGSEDPMTGSTCDGMDSDLCKEGTISCLGGALACSDNTASTLDLCNSMDDDCDPASSDGSEDPMNGSTCDGADTDFCKEGVYSCIGGALTCSDTTGNNLEICTNSIDDDCDGFTDMNDPDCP